MSGLAEGQMRQELQAGCQDAAPAPQGQLQDQLQEKAQGQPQDQGQSQEQVQEQGQDQEQAQPPFGDVLPEIADPGLPAGRLSGGAGLRGRAVLALAGLCGLGAFGLWSLAAPDQEEQVKLDAVQAQGSRMRAVSPATSPDYRDRLGAYSERRGNQALAQGGTFIAPQEGVHEPEPGDPALAPQVRKAPAPEPRSKPKAAPQPVRFEPQPAPPRPPVPRREALAQRRERGDSGLVSYLASLRREPGAPQTLVLRRAAPSWGAASAGESAGGPAFLPSRAVLAQLAPARLPAGRPAHARDLPGSRDEPGRGPGLRARSPAHARALRGSHARSRPAPSRRGARSACHRRHVPCQRPAQCQESV